MTRDEYHALLACSFSGLRDLSRSPAFAKWRREHPDEDTDATLRGASLHCAILEPDAFDKRYVLKDFDARTKDGKARKAEVEASGMKALSADVWDAVKRSADAILLDPAAKPILDACAVRETPIVRVVNGVPCKGIPDAHGKGVIVDLKSTMHAAPTAFPRFIANSRPDAQLAFYEALKAEDCDRYVVAVTDDAPHEVYVYTFDDALIAQAWEWLRPRIARWDECMKSGAWPAGPGVVIDAVRAKWDVFAETEAVVTSPEDWTL